MAALEVEVKYFEMGLDFLNAEVDELKDKMNEENCKSNHLQQIKKLERGTEQDEGKVDKL